MTLTEPGRGPAQASGAVRRSAEDLDPGHRTAYLELVDAVHRLNLAATVTELGEDELRRARGAIDELSATLERQTRARCLRSGFDGPAQSRESGVPYRLCRFNPWGVPFEISFDGDSAHASLVANALHEGPTDSVHGGVGAWLMDCMLGMLMQASGRRAVTASLDLSYRARTPLDQPLEMHSRITRTEGRKTWAEGWIEHEERRTLEATGLFVAVDPSARA